MLAEPNSVVISRRTRRLIGGLFKCVDLGAHLLKGFEAPAHTTAITLRPGLSFSASTMRWMPAVKSVVAGARITGKAEAIMTRNGRRYALAAPCIGCGQGIATVLEAV